jgi:hypothetical protein
MSQPPLNDFQRVMRQWAELAPYNCGPLMKISGAADITRWGAAFAAALRPLGLTGAETLPVESSDLPLDRKVADELNRPFAPGDLPLRAYVVPGESDSHWFGMMCDHWIADSRSLRALSQRVFAHYAVTGAGLAPLSVANDAHPTAGPLAHARALLSSTRNYLGHYRAHRMPLGDAADFTSDFMIARFPVGAIHSIRAFAKKQQATVNDVFIAAAAQVLGEFTGPQRELSRARFPRPRRDRVAIATAVDLRSAAESKRDDVFGLALGYFSVIVGRPESRSLDELAREIATETSVSKSKTRALQADWNLRIARRMWERLSHPRSKAQLFQKGMPLVAGISNVNLTGSWADQSETAGAGPRVLDYLRVSPVGPLLPMVFTVTTIGDRLSLCVTFRTTAFSRADCERLASGFIERLLSCAADLVGPPRAVS